MNALEQSRFDALYDQHLTALKLHGKALKTVEPKNRTCRVS